MNIWKESKPYGLPHWVWSVLYRPFHFISHSGDATWKTGGSALHSTDGGQSLSAFWQAGASNRVFAATPNGRDVWSHNTRGFIVFDRA